MGRELISKGVSLTVPLLDGRRVTLTPDDRPIPEDQVHADLISLLDGEDEYTNRFLKLRDDGKEESETTDTPNDSGDGGAPPETAPGSGDSDPDADVDDDDGDGDGEENGDDDEPEIDWPVVESMNAKDLHEQLKSLKEDDTPENMKIFDAIIAWERSNKKRSTVLEIAE